MGRVAVFWGSTIGRKIVMGLTGVVLVAFVIVHLAGNLLVYRGPEAENHYASLLKANPLLLWTVRGVLLAALILHVWAGLSLAQLARESRPTPYRTLAHQVTTPASRSMRWGGLFLLLFIVIHLLHFTTGTLHPRFDTANVYGNLVTGFQIWYAALFYLVAMVLLGLHLFHGGPALFQSLGLSHPGYDRPRRQVMRAVAVVLFGGFASIPLAIWLGLVK